MPTLPVLSGQACIKALEKAGFVVARQAGSHIILRRSQPAPARTVSVLNHNELDRGTLRAIIRQAGVTIQEFLDLLN